ncbi:MAG TPA: SUMF1/EgtB/PvdO family nonheme iron enzyme, partial [Blastocatellia bacterium]|nr:SUMF1/EgtB/PvdO family nonheme iron enzyme [Blastocatellia bacterium]
EWCRDWYDENYYRQSPKENPPGPSSGEYRVLRGGSWGFINYHRSADRLRDAPGNFYHYVGFRVCCVARTS